MFFRKYLKMNEEGEGGGGPAVLGGSDVEPAPVAEVEAPVAPVSLDAPVAPVEITFPENWKEGIAEDLRNEPSLANVPDIPTLVKNYIHAQRNMGKKGVHLPDQHSTDDDRKSFFQQMGLPAELDKYELAAPKDSQFEDGFLTEFKEAAFGANILPEQSAKLLEWYSKATNSAIERTVTSNKADMQSELQGLKREWGAEYENRKSMANTVLRQIGDEGVHKWIRETGLEDSAQMIKLMSKIGEMMKEDNVIDFGDNVGPTHKELDQRIHELEGNFKGPLYDRKHPNHAAAVKERDVLYQQKYPGQA